MKTTIIHLGKRHEIDSYFSLRPLIGAWQQKKRTENAGKEDVENLGIKNFDFLPADQEVLQKIHDLVQEVFPSALTLHHANESRTSIHLPFQNLNDSHAQNLPINFNLITDAAQKKELKSRLSEAYFLLAYQTIIEQLYGIAVHFSKAIVYRTVDPDTSMVSFTELVLDASFLSATCKKALPMLDKHLKRKLLLNAGIDEMTQIPGLENFKFSGFILASSRDVTQREIIRNCRNFMIKNEVFPDSTSLLALREEMRLITGLNTIDLGLFLTADYAAVEIAGDDFLPSYIDPALIEVLRKPESSSYIASFFSNRQELFISSLAEPNYRSSPILSLFFKSGIKSLLLYPLKINNKLVGIFGVGSPFEEEMKREHANILEPLVSVLAMAVERSVERLETKVDKIIKEQFTAVQSSVDWKFKEIALNHLRSGASSKKEKIERVMFENVHPLYGSIDVRNSSIERMHAIQQDLLKQLRITVSIITKATGLSFLPLLGEMKFRLEKYIEAVSVMLLPGDEITIQQYLQNEISGVLKHLARQFPAIGSDIDEYFLYINSASSRNTTNCSQFEQSINTINAELSKFIDLEQQRIQQVYPHYFERFVTDGIDFNIYMGQSICPSIPFEPFHLQNLKLWQLTTLISGARLTYRLSKELPVPLQTTQLILVHSKPLNISFRAAERKFDVDGSYNIHYEIVKKRIDKVRIRSTNERLTQPGTIAIVYSHAAEAKEYTGYLEYLEKAGLVFGEIERHDLEELRGVVGLKALRARIVMETTNEMIAGALKDEPAVADTEID